MQIEKLITSFSYNQKTVELTPNRVNRFEEFYADFKLTPMAGKAKGHRLELTIHPKVDLTLQHLRLKMPHGFEPHETIFCNGFQSWSESREFHQKEELENLRKVAYPFMKNYGDYHLDLVERGKGIFHSWTYSYLRQHAFKMQFIGSLSEKTGFTLIQYKPDSQLVVVDKECQDMQLAHSFPILDLIILEGTDEEVFDTYFTKMNIENPTAQPATGWTSWYNYYTNISEEIILKNLNAFAEKNTRIDFFQIDDGWQKEVGDWLTVKNNFPNGMGAIAQKIHAKGYKAGLWLAPFICEKKSAIFENKKHWLVKDANGKPVKAGYSPGWSGHFYALDFYNEEVQDYLIKVFFKILSKWNFDLVKLDFLYAACILPRPNKTRGQIMNDAMQFIRHLVGDKLILGCGVPLGSAFGLVDYCRIGADIHLEWEHKLLKFLRNRERVSTILSLRSTLGRWQLNGRAFLNDPDVFLLRDENLKLTDIQKHTVLLVNVLLGGLVFTSDDVGAYTDKKWTAFNYVFKYQNSTIKSVKNKGGDFYTIEFVYENKDLLVAVNLSEMARNFTIQKQSMVLKPFETVILE